MTQNPNKFDENDFINDSGTDGLEGLPKKSDGSFNVETMTAEQKALYWEHQANASTRGFHKYKQENDEKINRLEKEINKSKEVPTPQNHKFKEFGLNEQATGVLKKTVELAKNETIDELVKNPIFQNAFIAGNKARLEEAFQTLSSEKGYEYILSYKKKIIDEHFNDPINYPDDILKVLRIIAGNVLWEHKDEIALKNKPKHDQVDMLGGDGGDKSSTVAPVRSMAYWENLAKEDPQKFASPEMQKLFNSDVAKGIQ